MFVCPTCERQFKEEKDVVKHYLNCWKENHPNYKSGSAPESAAVERRRINDEVLNFFTFWSGNNGTSSN